MHKVHFILTAGICLCLAVPAGATVMKLEITETGQREGHAGFYQQTFQGGQWTETQFLVPEGDFIRLYAFKKPHYADFSLFPEGTYLIKRTNLAVGDRWLTYFSGPAVATVTHQTRLKVPAGTFDCFEVEIRDRRDEHDIQFVAWFSPDLGVIQWGVPDVALLVLRDFRVISGTGPYPLGVGNYWVTGLPEARSENSWGEVKKEFR